MGINMACKSLQKLAGRKLAQARPSGLEPAPARNQPSPPRRTFLCKTGKRTHLLAVIKFLNYVEEEHLKHVISFKVTMRGQLGKKDLFILDQNVNRTYVFYPSKGSFSYVGNYIKHISQFYLILIPYVLPTKQSVTYYSLLFCLYVFIAK